MAFDPTAVPEDGTSNGHLDDTPIYEILLGLLNKQETGRLTIPGPTGDNHMFFMRGRPVGVQLADYFHPLGQLLLELGRIDATTFIKAQRLIAEGNRLPGQVFMHIGVLDEQGLNDVLGVQANRKAEEFCRMGGRPYAFGRGLTFLTGFQSTALDLHAVLFLAIRQQMGPASRNNWLEELMNKELHIEPGTAALPSPLEVYGFGPPEERFLTRLQAGWQSTRSLAETGSLPDDEMAVLLRYLHIIGRVQVREKAAPLPPASEPVQQPTEPDVFAAGGNGADNAQPRKRRSPERVGNDLHALPKEAPKPAPAKASPPPRKKERPRDKPKEKEPKERERKTESIVVAPDLLEAPKKKKRRKRRAEPLPSTGDAAEMETRREKTNIGPLPSIMIDPE